MKTRLKDSTKTYKYLKKLPKVYLVGCWYRYGVREHYFSGKFKKYESGVLEPLVWDFDDHNGTYDEWVLRPIRYTTTGSCITWTFYRETAERIADKFNYYDEKERKECQNQDF